MNLEQEVFEKAIAVFPEPHRHHLSNVYFFVDPEERRFSSANCFLWRHVQFGQTFDIIVFSLCLLKQKPQAYLRPFFHELAHVLLIYSGCPEPKDRNSLLKAEWQASNLASEWFKAAGEAVWEVFEEFVQKSSAF